MNDNSYSDGQQLILIVLGAGLSLLAFAFVGRLIGQKRGQADAGALLGAILGPLGLIGAAFLPDKRRQCPACKGGVPDDARKCMHCGEVLPVKSETDICNTSEFMSNPTSDSDATTAAKKQRLCGHQRRTRIN